MTRPTREAHTANATQASNPGQLEAAAEARGLDQVQLTALERSFRLWAESSRRQADRFSRQRLRLIFLLLRSTGARLGEVLGLNPARDLALDQDRPAVRFGAREVPLPTDVVEALRAALADTELMASLAGGAAALFDMDQGHVRRKFYERAHEAGIPRELASPSVLRRTRARQLMRQDVPLPIVQRLLGQSSADLTAAFSDYTEAEAGRILEDYLKREERRKTSARNRFSGQITRVKSCAVVSEIELTSLGGFKVYSVVTRESVERLGIAPGVLATADIKAPWVQISAGAVEPASSAANRYPATVRRIVMGGSAEDDVAAEVVVELADGTRLAAVITAQSARKLALRPGMPVWASFGAFSVILNFT